MNKKNKFLAFLCACIPGVGELYQGYMKRGVSIMLLFWGVVVLSGALYLPFLGFLAPVIWFFAFFDTMNKSNWTEDQLALVEDKSVFEIFGTADFKCQKQPRKWIGIGGIVLGVVILFNLFSTSIITRLASYFNIYISGYFMHVLPSVIVAVAIIIIGIKMLATPVKKSDDEEN